MVFIDTTRSGLSQQQTQLTDLKKFDRDTHKKATCQCCDFREICNGEMWEEYKCYENEKHKYGGEVKSYTRI